MDESFKKIRLTNLKKEKFVVMDRYWQIFAIIFDKGTVDFDDIGMCLKLEIYNIYYIFFWFINQLSTIVKDSVKEMYKIIKTR